ncbi:MAG: calmodulin [Gammaproteobacteria bacterium]|jgi:hypothetical protein
MKKLMMTMVLLGAGSGPAGAEVNSAIPFSTLDVDRDDTLTMTEAGLLPEITFQWRALDRDGDGRLNRGEYASYSLPEPAAGRQD